MASRLDSMKSNQPSSENPSSSHRMMVSRVSQRCTQRWGPSASRNRYSASRTISNAAASCRATSSSADVMSVSSMRPRPISSTTRAVNAGAASTAPSATRDCQDVPRHAVGLRACQARAKWLAITPASAATAISTSCASADGEVSRANNCCRSLSGIEIGNGLALELGDLVLEQQLALLEAPHLQLVGAHVHLQLRDHLVQVAVLNAQLSQFLDIAEQLAIDVVFVIVRHGGYGGAGSARFHPVA